MTVIFRPLNIIPSVSFGGWNGAWASSGIPTVNRNRVDAFADTALNRYVGFRFPGTSNNPVEFSTKAAPGVWASVGITPVNMQTVRDIFPLPGVVPDTLLVGMGLAAGGRLFRWISGTGWLSLGFPEQGTSDAVSVIEPTSDPDLFLIGNQATATLGAPALWTFRLSTLVWTKIGGTGINGSWTFVTTNGDMGNVIFRAGTIYVIVGDGTANGLQVWRSPNMGATWTQIGGNGLFGSWPFGTDRNGSIAFGGNGKLYAGIGGGVPSAWECSTPDGVPAWVMIGNSVNWGPNGTVLNAGRVVSRGNKVVFGLSGTVAGDSRLWEFDTDLRTWVQLAVGVWSRSGTAVLYVSPFDNKLFAGVGNNSSGTANLFEVAAVNSGTAGASVFYPAPMVVRV